MPRLTRSQYEVRIQNREAYEAASSHAEVHPGSVGQGQLNEGEYAALRTAVAEGRVSYLVYSYYTPIAWILDGQAHVTAQRFSQTTSQLQHTCRYGLGL
jgi:hypothetical protein